MSSPQKRPASRYGDPTYRRTGLAPGLLAGIALLIGVALIESETFIVIRYVVAILALVLAFFAFQVRHWWWIPPLVAIAVIWNPVYPFGFDGPVWSAAQYVAILVFVVAGIFIKVPATAEDTRR